MRLVAQVLGVATLILNLDLFAGTALAKAGTVFESEGRAPFQLWIGDDFCLTAKGLADRNAAYRCPASKAERVSDYAVSYPSKRVCLASAKYVCL